MGFPVRTKGTGTRNTCSLSGVLWEQGTGNREQVTRRPAGPPEAKFYGVSRKFFFGGGESLREQGTGNREHAVFPKCSRNMFRNHSGKTHP